jgi:nicotinate-nucleotide pyrophosphorylase (carboxylating)
VNVVQTAVKVQPDIREIIFAGMNGRQFSAEIVAERDGIVAGIARLRAALAEAGIGAELLRVDGGAVKAGSVVGRITGSAMQIAIAEEFAIGKLAKSSGIATAAHQAVRLAGGEMKIVCGAWKKMPAEIKSVVREAIVCGGAAFRISDQPFLYLDKNFVRMLGGIEATLNAVAPIHHKLRVIQLKGEFAGIAQEAILAVTHGADILMIDTGNLADLEAANKVLEAKGLRQQVKLAFAKGVRLRDIAAMKGLGIDILDIGSEIVDAPLLDMKMDVRGVSSCN